jgi:hypothetical protein
MAAYLEFVRTPTYEADIAGMLTAEAERKAERNALKQCARELESET